MPDGITQPGQAERHRPDSREQVRVEASFSPTCSKNTDYTAEGFAIKPRMMQASGVNCSGKSERATTHGQRLQPGQWLSTTAGQAMTKRVSNARAHAVYKQVVADPEAIDAKVIATISGTSTWKLSDKAD